MAANKIKFNSAGFRAILMGSGTRTAVVVAASSVSSRAPGTKVRPTMGGFGGGRHIAFVATSAKTARDAERQREALESAVHGM